MKKKICESRKVLHRKKHRVKIYEKYIKRFLDIVFSASALVVFSPLMLLLAGLVRWQLGSPVIFRQNRPGKDEKIFEMYKFRSMTDGRDEEGNLLSDEERLTDFGKMLRASSLDELPELVNILKGDMSIVGPRPQLIRDMVFMTPEQRIRHTVRPGLSGLAQVNGRNAIEWEEKIKYDLKYIEKITFLRDAGIVVQTVKKALIGREGITENDNATAEDYGDYLLKKSKVTQEEYDKKQKEAGQIILENSMRRKNVKRNHIKDSLFKNKSGTWQGKEYFFKKM